MISRRNLLLATAASSLSLPSFAAGKTYTPGKEYLVLEPALPTDTKKIEVVKFFAYTCSHCLAFEPVFHEWEKRLPEDVVVRVCPVAWNEKFLPFTQVYFALEAMGLLEKLHQPFFESVIYQTHVYDFENPVADITASWPNRRRRQAVGTHHALLRRSEQGPHRHAALAGLPHRLHADDRRGGPLHDGAASRRHAQRHPRLPRLPH